MGVCVHSGLMMTDNEIEGPWTGPCLFVYADNADIQLATRDAVTAASSQLSDNSAFSRGQAVL